MYGGGADFGGGGFMPTQSNIAASEQPRKSGAPSSGLFPLTVKQISVALQNSADDNLLVDGQEVSNVTLVGIMCNKEEKTTDVTFMLDDGTGRVEVKRWIDTPEAPEALELREMTIGSYVRVHGHLRTFQNRRNVVAFSVRAIKDFNEVTFHFLECIFVHLHNSKLQGNGRPQASNLASFPANPSTKSTITAATVGNNNSAYMQQAAMSNANNLDEAQQRVLSVFEEPENMSIEQGPHLNDVLKKVRLPEPVFRTIIDHLVNEGYIYSTIDEFHFRSTSGSETAM